MKTKEFIDEAKLSEIKPVFRKMYPSIITRKTGIVAFRLNMRFDMCYLSFRHGRLRAAAIHFLQSS